MDAEIGLVYQFVMVAAAIWLFVHLTFGFGTIREAIFLGFLGIMMLFLMEGASRIVFSVVFIAGGLLAMRAYKVDMRAGAMFVLCVAAISQFMFPFAE